MKPKTVLSESHRRVSAPHLSAQIKIKATGSKRNNSFAHQMINVCIQRPFPQWLPRSLCKTLVTETTIEEKVNYSCRVGFLALVVIWVSMRINSAKSDTLDSPRVAP